MSRILETKVPCPDHDRVRSALRGAGARPADRRHQRDTYFRCPEGWLKLRESTSADGGDGRQAQLVAYRRTAGNDGRQCDYQYTDVADPEACRAGLAAVLGTLVEVRKTRETWQLGQTTVHLDEVDRLGRFLELETASLTPDGAATGSGTAAAALTHQEHCTVLGVRPEDDLGVSYEALVRAVEDGSDAGTAVPGGGAGTGTGTAGGTGQRHGGGSSWQP